MTTFQRARSEEQREVRRHAILETAAAMLSEMPVSQLSLNELSRRVGLAKSNVLRYFESREGVLLDLLEQLARDVLTEITAELPVAVAAGAPLRERVNAAAETASEVLARHEMFCELVSAQAGVLEHNVSPETVIRFKRGGYEVLAGFATALRQVLPELDEPKSTEAAQTVMMLLGTLWTHSHPPEAVLKVYASDPDLVFLPEGFRGSLERAILVQLLGLLAV